MIASLPRILQFPGLINVVDYGDFFEISSINSDGKCLHLPHQGKTKGWDIAKLKKSRERTNLKKGMGNSFDINLFPVQALVKDGQEEAAVALGESQPAKKIIEQIGHMLAVGFMHETFLLQLFQDYFEAVFLLFSGNGWS
jgi:hypothetical protein